MRLKAWPNSIGDTKLHRAAPLYSIGFLHRVRAYTKRTDVHRLSCACSLVQLHGALLAAIFTTKMVAHETLVKYCKRAQFRSYLG